MNQEHYIKRASEVIKKIHYATLATTTPDGMPWNSPVRHEYDKDLTIYWFSDKESQHSRNVQANGAVFIVIYDSTVPEGQGAGVYIQAAVTELSDPEEILCARKLKKGEDFVGSPLDFQGDAVRRVYKATPQHVWMNSAEIQNGAFIRDYRIEIPLDKLQDYLVASSSTS